MNITIKSTNIELTAALKDYTEKRLAGLQKFAGNWSQVMVEIGQTTAHHRQGNIFRAEVNVRTESGGHYRAVSEQADLYRAIDDVKDEITRELTSGKDKKQVLWKRGARAVKDIMRDGYDAIKRFGFKKKE